MRKTLKSYRLVALSTLVLSMMGIGGAARAEQASGHGWEAAAAGRQPMHGWEATAEPTVVAAVGHGYEATAEPTVVAEVGHGYEATAEPDLNLATGRGWRAGINEPNLFASTDQGSESVPKGEQNPTSSRAALSGSASDRSPNLEVDPLHGAASLALAFLVGIGCALTMRHLRLTHR